MADKAEETVAPTVSVEDRIGDKFERLLGWNETPEAEQPEAAAPEGESEEPEAASPEKASDTEEATPDEGSEFVEVEFSGVKYHVPPELKDALMATQDYTKKTTEVAQVRKSVDLQVKELALAQEQRKFEASVMGDLDQLRMMDAYIDHENKNTNWQSLDTTAAFRKKMELDQLKERRAELQTAVDAKYKEFKTKIDGERSKLRTEMAEVLSKSIPSWSDDVKGSLEKYAISLGYPELAAQNMSAMDYQVAWKAMQYDKIKSEAATTVKKAATPTITSTSRKEMPKGVQDKLNYRKAIKKAGSQKERQRLAEDRIASIFGG